MRELSVLLEQYLQTRRAAGAKLKDPEWLLRQFLSFLAQRQVTVITTDLALQWAIEPRNVQPFYRHRRLAEVRRFARYASAVDSRNEIPPQGLLPYRKHRTQPYIYTADEIVTVINAAKQLSGRIRPLTYSTILGLLSVTAMRSGEVVNLDRDDVDLRQGLITISNAKFGKSRMVTCHQTTRKVLSEYAARRDELLPCPVSSAFFLSDQGMRISPHTLRNTFANLSRATGLRRPLNASPAIPKIYGSRGQTAVFRPRRINPCVNLCIKLTENASDASVFSVSLKRSFLTQVYPQIYFHSVPADKSRIPGIGKYCNTATAVSAVGFELDTNTNFEVKRISHKRRKCSGFILTATKVRFCITDSSLVSPQYRIHAGQVLRLELGHATYYSL